MKKNDRLPKFSVSQISKLNIINEHHTLEEGLRYALHDASQRREVSYLAMKSGISKSTLYQFKDRYSDSITLYNAEKLLEAMGFEIIVRLKV